MPLTARDRGALGRQQPVNPKAYDLYLRANHLGANTSNPSRLTVARDLYRQCLEEDPDYAPAWARLGRVYRVLAKYGAEGQVESIALAEQAFNAERFGAEGVRLLAEVVRGATCWRLTMGDARRAAALVREVVEG